MSEVAATQPVLCLVDDAVARSRDDSSLGVRRTPPWAPTRSGSCSRPARSSGTSSASRSYAWVGSRIDSRVLLDSVLIGHVDGPSKALPRRDTRKPARADRTPSRADACRGGDRDGSSIARLAHRQDRGTASGVSWTHIPADTRRLLVVAAAEERLAIRSCSSRAAARLGLSVESGDPAEEAGLFQVRERCSFRHPLVRSAVYGAATPEEATNRARRPRRGNRPGARPGSEGVASSAGNTDTR